MKAFLFFLCVCTSCAYADMSNQQLVGYWKLTKWLIAERIGQLGPEDTASLIGKTLVITPQAISLKTTLLSSDDRTCTINPATSGWVVNNPIRFFDNNYDGFFNSDDFKTLNLKLPFWTLDSDCVIVFTKSLNNIVLLFGNNYFEAVRISNS